MTLSRVFFPISQGNGKAGKRINSINFSGIFSPCEPVGGSLPCKDRVERPYSSTQSRGFITSAKMCPTPACGWDKSPLRKERETCPLLAEPEKKNRIEKKERVEGGEFCAPRSGAARSGFTRGLRRCSGFLRPAPTAELRHRHSHHAEYPPRDRATLGMLPARPSERPGLQGLRAPPAPGLLRAARASLPRTQPLRLPGPSDRHCHPHLGGDGEGGMRGPPRSLPRAFPPLSAAGSLLGLGFGPPRAGGGASARSRGDPRVRPPHRSWGGEKQPR